MRRRPAQSSAQKATSPSLPRPEEQSDASVIEEIEDSEDDQEASEESSESQDDGEGNGASDSDDSGSDGRSGEWIPAVKVLREWWGPPSLQFCQRCFKFEMENGTKETILAEDVVHPELVTMTPE